MKFTLSKAAEEAGVSKSTIHRAIERGRLSATRLEDGSYEIDASELFRVYPPKPVEAVAPSPRSAKAPPETVAEATLAAEVKMLRELLERADLDHDRERRQLSDTIEDLRTRLDQEGLERRTAIQQLLAYQRPPDPSPPPAAPPAATARRSLFSRLKKAS